MSDFIDVEEVGAERADYSVVHVPGGRRERAKPPGRKSKLTPEVQALICRAIREGNFEKTAAALARVSVSTFEAWKARGIEARNLSCEGHPVPAREKPYLGFLEAIEEARAIAEAHNLQVHQDVAFGQTIKSRRVYLDGSVEEEYYRPDPRAIEWWMEHARQDTWGRKTAQVEHTGKDGGPISIEVEVSAREALAGKLRLVSDRLGVHQANEDREAS